MNFISVSEFIRVLCITLLENVPIFPFGPLFIFPLPLTTFQIHFSFCSKPNETVINVFQTDSAFKSSIIPSLSNSLHSPLCQLMDLFS